MYQKDKVKPLLSVVIATKNREQYCIAAIESLLKLTDGGLLHIAISDNSNTTIVSDYVKQIDSPFISYCYTGTFLSSIDNFNKVMSLVKGHYVCMIGDDDSVLPQIIDYTKWAYENNIDSFSFKHVNYFWPALEDDSKNGRLEIGTFTGEKVIYNPKQQLAKLMKNGIVNYIGFHLPKIYHGVVKFSLMEQIKELTGNYYGGLSPDIYSAVCLAAMIDVHYEIDLPLSIAGACPQSSTAQNHHGGHSGKLEDAPHFKGREFYQWINKLIPEFYSVETIWADSALSGLTDINRVDFINSFNQPLLLSTSIWNNRKWIFKFTLQKIEDLRHRNSTNVFTFYVGLFFGFVHLLFRKLKNSSQLSKKDKIRVVTNISNIESAENYILNQNI